MCLVTKVRYQRCSTTSTPSLAESVELRTPDALVSRRRERCTRPPRIRVRRSPPARRHITSAQIEMPPRATIAAGSIAISVGSVLCDGKRSSRARLLPASERHTSSTSEAQVEAVEAVELADERAAALPKPGVGYTDL